MDNSFPSIQIPTSHPGKDQVADSVKKNELCDSKKCGAGKTVYNGSPECYFTAKWVSSSFPGETPSCSVPMPTDDYGCSCGGTNFYVLGDVAGTYLCKPKEE